MAKKCLHYAVLDALDLNEWRTVSGIQNIIGNSYTLSALTKVLEELERTSLVECRLIEPQLEASPASKRKNLPSEWRLTGEGLKTRREMAAKKALTEPLIVIRQPRLA